MDNYGGTLRVHYYLYIIALAERVNNFPFSIFNYQLVTVDR